MATTPESSHQFVNPMSPRGRLLTEARQLFRSKGYEKTTVREIAAATGILSGSIFHHFPNKEEILYCIMEESILFTLGHLQEQLGKETSVVERLKTLIRCELDAIHCQHGHDFAILGSEWRSLSQANQDRILQIRTRYEKLWQDELQQITNDGGGEVEPTVLRHFIRGALIETINWYDTDGKYNLEAISLMVFETFFNRR